MVSESRQRLNQRLQENWREKTRTTETTTTTTGHDPSSSSSSSDQHTPLDDSELTNLSWLVGLDLECIAAYSTAATSTTTSTTGSGGLVVRSGSTEAREMADDDWQKRPRKPTHTYSAMITMAINETPEKQMTVAGIYSWIRNNFPYYRHTSATWKNSVRHCLSTNRRFQRVSQSRDKFGKRFWRIVSDCSSSRKTDNAFYDRRPLAISRGRNDGGIREAIRVVGRCETIEATADGGHHGCSRHSVPESIYESSSFDESSDLDSPSSSSGLLSPRWSSDSRLNDILNDLESNPPIGASFEPGVSSCCSSSSSSFSSSSSSSSSSCCFEQVSENAVLSQRLMNLDSDFLISDVTCSNDDWILTDISRSSCGRSLAEFLQGAGQEEFQSDLLDSDLSLKSIISEF